jgi:hypothetical protein
MNRARIAEGVAEKKLQSPIQVGDLESEEARRIFEELADAIRHSSEDEASPPPMNGSQKKVWMEEAIRAVRKHPILAQTVSSRHSSLLEGYCAFASEGQELLHENVHRDLKFLIQANPSALAWNASEKNDPLLSISSDKALAYLMPWIAANFEWVLHLRCFRLNARHFNIVGLFFSPGNFARWRTVGLVWVPYSLCNS